MFEYLLISLVCEGYLVNEHTFGFASIHVINVTATIFENKTDVLHFDWSPALL